MFSCLCTALSLGFPVSNALSLMMTRLSVVQSLYCSSCIPECTYHTNTYSAPLVKNIPVKASTLYKIGCLGLSSLNSTTPAYLPAILHLYSLSQSPRSSAYIGLLKLTLYEY